MADKSIVERLRKLIKELEAKTPVQPSPVWTPSDSGDSKERPAPGSEGPSPPPATSSASASRPGNIDYQQSSLAIEDYAGFKVFRSVYEPGLVPEFYPVPDDLLPGFDAIEPGISGTRGWLFIDIETTGLLGAATIPFLVGTGKWIGDRFELKQYFLASREAESLMLTEVRRDLLEHDVLVTFNGKAFDIPLLNSRFVITAAGLPFLPRTHLDLMNVTRSLGKHPAFGFSLKESVRRFTGLERKNDIPGHMIPALYFIYERDGDISVLEPVFRHNRSDVLDMACLCRVFANFLQGLGGVFKDPVALEGAGKLHLRKGNLDLARKCLLESCRNSPVFEETSATKWPETARSRLSGDRAALSGAIVGRMRLLADVMRKQGDWEHAKEIWERVVSSGNGNVDDYLWLARYHEVVAHDLERAIALTQECISSLRARGKPVPPPLARRIRRLEKLRKRKTRNLVSAGNEGE
ncbi:MAG TPA: hypothetical protein GXX30_04455 [Firmicutes bacterium]|nr:hypothetical protein [Candidatus Fermentithermobacillaceae bacterium]